MHKRIIALLIAATLCGTCLCGNGVLAAETTETVQREISTSDPTEAFVERLYQTLLFRTPDRDGLNDWTSQLKSGDKTGAQVVFGIVFSKEFTSKNYTNESFVDLLYAAVFDRSPDPNGRQGWLNALRDGFSRMYVLRGFIGSDEFKNLCRVYGILPGTIDLTETTDLYPDITRFVSYLYQNLLNRPGDIGGIRNWVTRLQKKEMTATDAVVEFVYSDEFKNLRMSDEDYIQVLYRTILRREADQPGLNDWMSALGNGMTRRYVLRGLLQSSEFEQLCRRYGLTQGTMTMTENRDKNRALTTYINYAYQIAYHRGATAGELNDWTGRLISNKMITTDFINALLMSDPLKSLSAESFVETAYLVALNRAPSTAEISSGKASAASSRQTFLDSITGNSEFERRVKNLGLTLHREGWNITPQGRFYVKNGTLVSGWQTIDGQKYFFDPANDQYAAVGWTYTGGYKYYFNSDGTWVQNVDDILGPQSVYHLTVNTSTNTVTVYAKDGANGFIIPVKAMICSTGAPGTPTVKGTFTLKQRFRWAYLMGNVWGQWVTRIYGGYLFHSTWYWTQNNRNLGLAEFNKLGTNASHGCVRLPAGDAKWVYDHCQGSTVTISSNCAQPLDKPGRPIAVQSGGRVWDPTDPTI